MPTHSSITDPYLHEPKGVSLASDGMVYMANGSGSGEWKYLPGGWAYYQHSSTGQVINTTASKLTIDGSGGLSYSGKLPREIRGSEELWDSTNNLITPIRLHDSYQVRVDIPITSETGSPTQLNIEFDIGGGATPSIVIFERFFPTGKTTPYTISFDTSLVSLTSTAQSNGIGMFCSTDAGSLTLGSPGITITRTSSGEF